jgi:predicted  nucleic acid-binding Zn-ribbon protein
MLSWFHEELSELISKTETIIENKENSMHLVEDQTTTIKKDFQDMRERIEEKMSMIRKQFYYLTRHFLELEISDFLPLIP